MIYVVLYNNELYILHILSILPAGAKLFSEVWLILSENGRFMLV